MNLSKMLKKLHDNPSSWRKPLIVENGRPIDSVTALYILSLYGMSKRFMALKRLSLSLEFLVDLWSVIGFMDYRAWHLFFLQDVYYDKLSQSLLQEMWLNSSRLGFGRIYKTLAPLSNFRKILFCQILRVISNLSIKLRTITPFPL